MAIDDDIALSLPEPPPPRPARREAAIDAALHRFDAQAGLSGGEAPRAAAPGKPVAGAPPRWTVSRPQLGALVSVALVALIGAPLAWMSVEHGPATISRETPAPTSPAPAATATATPGAPAPIAGTVPPVMSTPASQPAQVERAVPLAPIQAPGALPPPPPPPASPPSLPAPSSVLADNDPRIGPSAGMTAPAAPIVAGRMTRAESGAAADEARQDNYAAPMPAPAPPPPPPPAVPVAAPPMAMAKTEMKVQANSDIIVTGMRASRQKAAGRGDWNACTLNDPRRSLSGCKSLIDPGAKGQAGQAAARVADGLSLAWQGNLDGAIKAFDQAIVLQPRLSIAYLNRGLARQRKGDLDRAIADLDQAVRYAPGAARGYYNRSLALREHGDARRASADEARAVDLDPDYDAVVR